MTDQKATGFYTLPFSHIGRWRFVSTEATSRWMQRFASIMQLKTDEAPCDRTIVVVRGQLNDDNGWKRYELRGIRFLYAHDFSTVICDIGKEEDEQREYCKMRDILSPVHLHAPTRGGYPVHGALIEREGRGVILTAPSGTGKSTSCHRLPAPWRVLCDDETLVVQGGSGRYRAHPLPTWSEWILKRSNTTWDTSRHIPLEAVFCLEQSDHDEAIPLKPAAAALLLNASTSSRVFTPPWDKSSEENRGFQYHLFHNAVEIAKALPCYKLKAGRHGTFWEQMEKALL